MQVHHNYKTKDMVDGGGLCSPGRWLPSKRNLPDLGDVGKDLISAMGVDLGEFEQKAYKMFTGKLASSPFPPAQIEKGKAPELCIAISLGCVAEVLPNVVS